MVVPTSSEFSVEVFDAHGRLASTRPGPPQSGSPSVMTLDVGRLPSGIYFVRLRDGRGEAIGKPKRLVVVR